MLQPRRALLTITACGLALTLVACKGESPSPEIVRSHIERELPGAEFKKDTRIRLGRITFGLAKGVFKLVEPDDLGMSKAISNVKKVDIAIYEVVSLPEISTLELPADFERNLERYGWYPMVRTREDDSRVWVYYREDDAGSIRNLYVVELDEAELVVIDLGGRLDRVMAELIADDPDGFIAGIG